LYIYILSGWWLSPTPLKNDGVRQLGLLFPTEWKVNPNFMVPNHQPDGYYQVHPGILSPRLLECSQ
jgi:hypothetical protein